MRPFPRTPFLRSSTFAVALAFLLIVMSGTGSPSAATPPARPASTVKGPDPIPSDNNACALTEHEQQIASFMANAPDQQRPHLTCDPRLVEAARQHARDMAERNYLAHTTPDGYGPNYLVRQAGYMLPSQYSTQPTANNVESLGAGYPTAEGVWEGLMNSPTHRTHLLGTTPFFARQTEYGIGYAEGGTYGYYWVVITARPAREYAAR